MDYNFATLGYSGMDCGLCYSGMDYNIAALCYSGMDYNFAAVEWIILFSVIANSDIMTSLIIGYIKIVSTIFS